MSDIVTCDVCGSSVETLFCGQCGKDYRKRFPECELVSFHIRAFRKAKERQDKLTDAAGKKTRARVTKSVALTSQRLFALATILEAIGRPMALPGDMPPVPVDGESGPNFPAGD